MVASGCDVVEELLSESAVALEGFYDLLIAQGKNAFHLVRDHCNLCFYPVPTQRPSDVVVTPAGDNMVRVSWTPTSETTRYIVTYEGDLPGEEVERESASVVGGDARTTVLEGLRVGVGYSITVQAFGDLPGLVSTPADITLQGQLIY